MSLLSPEGILPSSVLVPNLTSTASCPKISPDRSWLAQPAKGEVTPTQSSQPISKSQARRVTSIRSIIKVNTQRRIDLETLVKLRQQVEWFGISNDAMFIYAVILAHCGLTESAIFENLSKLLYLRDSARRDLCTRAVQRDKRGQLKFKLTNWLISRWLRIREEEVPHLICLKSANWVSEKDLAETCQSRIDARRRCIQHIIRKCSGIVPSIRFMRSLVQGMGHKVRSARTISSDYVKLGVSSQRKNQHR